MKYRIEQIIQYLDKHPRRFFLREYASPQGDYTCEAVVFHPIVSDMIGIIIEENPFNPSIYYNESEMLATFDRLDDKTRRITHLIKKASLDFELCLQKKKRRKG